MLYSTKQDSLRARNVEARRQQILEAARKLIISDGVPGLTMRRLADTASLAVKTLYNLFGSRAAILETLVDQAMAYNVEALEAETHADDPIEQCRAVITICTAQLLEDEALNRAMILAQYQGLIEKAWPTGQASRRALALLSTALRSAIRKGRLVATLDPDLLAEHIYRGYHLSVLQWAYGTIDAEQLRNLALYGVHVALLAVATPATRSRLEHDLRGIERAVGRPASTTGTQPSAGRLRGGIRRGS